MEARYREALVGEEPLSVDANLAVIAGALNRCDAGDVADPGSQVFIAALVCGAALGPQVRELAETRALFDDDGYRYLRDVAVSWAGGEKEAIPLGRNASLVLAAALAWLRSSDPLPTVLAGWRAAARQAGAVQPAFWAPRLPTVRPDIMGRRAGLPACPRERSNVGLSSVSKGRFLAGPWR
jgi:hypothetical protein